MQFGCANDKAGEVMRLVSLKAKQNNCVPTLPPPAAAVPLSYQGMKGSKWRKGT